MALTHALAISLGPDVRVNCISPGWIATTFEGETKLRRKDHAQYRAPELARSQKCPAGSILLRTRWLGAGPICAATL